MVKILNDNKLKDQWDRVAGNPMQSWQWGTARQKMGIEVVRIVESYSKLDSESIKNRFRVKPGMTGVYQITFHKIPYTNFTIGYLPRSVVPSERVIKQIREEAIKRKCIFVKIEPYTISSKCKIQSEKLQLIIKNCFKLLTDNCNFKLLTLNFKLIKSNHPLFPNWTQMLDLTKSEEELLKNMKPKTRYNIRLAQKHGVTVREMTSDEGFEIFAKLYFDTCRRQNYKGHTPAYHKIIFDSLKDNIAHIFIAFHKDIPLCAYEVFMFNDILYYPYGGSSLEYKNVMAPNLLMWEVIKFGKKSGAKVFDMWGSLPPDYFDSNLWSGFTKFKQGYGTEFVEFLGSYDLIINKPLYNFYNLADKIRKKII